MKFVVLGFIDEAKLAEVPQEEAKRRMEVCFAYDDELRRGGHFLGGEALDSAAVTLSMKEGAIAVTDGPFAETKETLGGILLLEARDLKHAIALMSKHPAIPIMGVSFEIRPAGEAMNRLVAERSAAFAKQA